MRLINLKNFQPDIGRKIVVLYESDLPQNLQIIVDRYDGSLTHRKEMKRGIFWTYYEHFFEDVDCLKKGLCMGECNGGLEKNNQDL